MWGPAEEDLRGSSLAAQLSNGFMFMVMSILHLHFFDFDFRLGISLMYVQYFA